MRRIGMLTGIAAAAAVAMFIAMDSPLNAADADLEAVKKQFVGHYELLSYVSFPEGGGVVDNNYEGRITYDEHDNMTAQGMPKDLPARAAASSTNVSGGFAYYGSVTWDIENQIVTHHVEGSPSRGSWVGEDNVRHYAWEDGLLKLSIVNAEGRTTGTLTWRRYE